MLIWIGYDSQFQVPAPVAMAAMPHMHPARTHDLPDSDRVQIDLPVPVEQYTDGFGNLHFTEPSRKLNSAFSGT